MKTYSVMIPITGVMYTLVNASSEEEAIAKALDDCVINDLETWEADEDAAEIHDESDEFE